jgi:hypothetical protein
MTDGLYAVMIRHLEAAPVIHGVFSSEGLAQTHAAKLRLGKASDTVYTVEPLPIDELVNHEMVYWGYYEIRNLRQPQLDENKIQIHALRVQAHLPQDTMALDLHHMLRPDATYYAYAWDPKTAWVKVRQMVIDHLHEQGVDVPLIPLEAAS